jgi:hypothetical protein
MTHDYRGAESLLEFLVAISGAMIEISNILSANTHVQSVTRGSDVRQYRDFMRPDEKKLNFETYVEAETRTGETISWLLDLSKTAAGWEIHRVIDRQTRDGGMAIATFDNLSFEQFDKLVDRCSDALKEFVNSAKTFDFVNLPS